MGKIDRIGKILIVFFGLAILVNLVWLDYHWFKSSQKDNAPQAEISPFPTAEPRKEPEPEPTLEPEPTVIIKQTQTQVISSPKVAYIPLAGSGSTILTSWTDIIPSEFYFNLEDYPGVKQVRFEAYLLARHGSAKVYTRLYDQTNFRGVDFSDLETQSESYVRLESSPITIWRGNNKYTVQLRSINGTEVQLKEAKLRIAY